LVGVREGLSAAVPRSLYVPDLILSMNDVAMDVSFQINEAANNETRTRRLLLRSTQQQQRQQQQQQSRRLQINVQFPTSIDGLIETSK
jgi:sensor histidine kinase YesM